MARYVGPVCRLCRREGVKLYLKGDRCYTDKCAVNKRNFAPGMHRGTFQKKLSEYGLQLREKQKLRRLYGVLEKQFRRVFERAARQKGITGENLVSLLESRLDNVVFRMGFASSRSQSRQFVTHGHIELNGKKATIPSMLVKVGDLVSVKSASQKLPQVQESMNSAARRGSVPWIDVKANQFSGNLTAMPQREALNMPIDEQQIVELYAR